MAIRDITLGRYFPGNTPIHRLDPRTKLLLTLFYIIALFLAHGIVTYLILFAALVSAVAISHIKPKAILKGLKPLFVILEPGQVIRRGERQTVLYLAQSILVILAEVYGSIGTPSLNGLLDVPTADALMTFQGLNGLPMTGELDKITWKNLALQYPRAASRYWNLETGESVPPRKS